MRRYETIMIVDSELSDEERSSLFEKVQDIIPSFNGIPIVFDEWGAKRLAYEIKKKSRGYYVRIDYCGDGTLVNEMERFFRINDSFLKYMTILLDENADPEKIKEEIAATEKEKAQDTEDTQNETKEPEAKNEPVDKAAHENVGTTSTESNKEE